MLTRTTRLLPPDAIPTRWLDHVEQHGLHVYEVRCDTPEYDEVVRLRAVVYGITIDGAADDIDRYSTIWLVRQNGRPVCTLRGTMRRHGVFDCEQFFPPALVSRFEHAIVSASRFCRARELERDVRVGPMLVELAWQWALGQGIRLDVIDANVAFAGYYEKLGYRTVPGSEFCHPLLGTPSKVMFLAADPDHPGPLAHLFVDCPDPLPVSEVHAALRSNRPVAVAPSDAPLTAEPALVPGAVISFSAGAQAPRPDAYRLVTPQEGKLGRLLANFPQARRLLTAPPLVVNAYPAPVERLVDAVLVDTYGRQSAFSAALMLAAGRNMPVILVAMPVAAAELVVAHLAAGYAMPKAMVLLLGGHATPRSLERYLAARLADAGCEVATAFLYGVAEIEAALLAAVERDDDGAPVYVGIDGRWRPEVRDGVLGFVSDGSDWVATDEHASPRRGGWVVGNHPTRLDPAILAELETWGRRDWDRRTGALGREADRLVVQLRVGHEPSHAVEVEHFEFARRHGFSWLNKPRWGVA